ncbi:MAG: ATP-binding protein [Cyanobacteriota bacterium]|nr:ATP-binding protein [Cyanobacteriota bacterium]
MKLKTKILLGYGAALLLALGMGGWGTINLKRLGRASNAILQENYRSILAAEKTIDALERQDSAVLLVMLGDRQEGLEQFREFEIVLLQWLGRAKDNITIPGEAEIVATLETQYRDYLIAFSQLQTQLSGDRTPNREVTTAYYYDRVLPVFEAVRQTSLELLELNQQTMEAASDRAQVLSERAIWSTVALGGATVGVGVVASLLLANRLTRPLQTMTRAAEQIADGDYDVTLPVDSDDELGILAVEMQGMSRKLKAFRELNVGRVIAEKKRSEAIVRSIADGLVVVDEGLRIVAINPTAAKIFEIDSVALEDVPFLEAIDDRPLYEYLKTTLKTQKPPRLNADESVRSIESEEKTEYYQLAIAPVKNTKHQLLGVVLLLKNVTELKELDRLKSDFVATASHELRTPLTGMAMSVDLLLETAPAKLSDRESELLAATQEDIQRLRALVNDLLDLSKIESGRIDLEFTPVDVKFLINKVIDTFKVQVEEKNVRLAIADSSDSLTVNADANKIAWVLTNLVGNALRYSDDGGTIVVNARQGGRWVYISVEDNGPGIPLEYQAKIFDKFVQVKTDRDIGGSGLGLAICQEIVKAHGGTIWVESTPPDGSKFTFTLSAVAPSERPLS